MSFETLLDRNKAFAATDAVAKNPQIPWLPSQLAYVITCIDSRTEPAGFLGVDLGDATVQPVIGGRVTLAVLRDVAYISYLTEPKTLDGPRWDWRSSTTLIAARRSWPTRAAPWLRRPRRLRPGRTGLAAGDYPAATVRADVNTLVTAPQLSPNIVVSGYVYNTAVGTLDTVVSPTPVGKG